jgi:hypothetical protein
MATIGLGFQLSASAAGMASGINAGAVELQKLGYAAKQTARDVSTLKTIEISKVFISSVQSIASTFQNFTSGAAAAIDQTLKLSRSLGVSYEELNALQIAADLSGASSEQLAKAFTKAQVTIVNAAKGSKEAKQALSDLGLSVETLATQTSTQQFSTLATAINSIQNPAERAAAAVKIFGKSGAELLPVFQGLPESLQQANTFLGQFQGGLNAASAAKIEAVNDAFTLAGRAIGEVAGKLLAELAPTLKTASDQFVAFVAKIDIGQAAIAVSDGLASVAGILSVVANVAQPLAKNLLPAIGGYLAFINRQAIAAGIKTLGSVFVSAASAAIGYSGAATAAAASTAALGVSIRTLLASTGLGVFVVVLGLAAGALVELAVAGASAGDDTTASIEQATAQAKAFTEQLKASTGAAFNLGEEVKNSLKVPESIAINEFAQGSLDEARSAIVSLAKELGGLDRVPANLLTQFAEIAAYAGTISQESLNEAQALKYVDRDARAVIATITRMTEQRKKEADAAKEAADAQRKAADEAKKRVQELATQGLTAPEQSRLQLNKDLLEISRERLAAEQAMTAAMRAGDVAGQVAARDRLALIEQATQEARNQARQRDIAALGINEDLLKPAKTLADEFRAVKKAFDQRLINPVEAGNALRNLAKEGIDIRREIATELRKPAQQALQLQDIRTNEGMSKFLNLSLNREDPAIEQRKQQLQKLDEIRRELRAANINPADILG